MAPCRAQPDARIHPTRRVPRAPRDALAGGRLGRRGVEFDLLPWQQQRALPLMAYSPLDQGALAAHAGLQSLAAELGATPAQLALARLLAQPGVMVIPKSADAARLRQNFEAASLQLDTLTLERIDAMFAPPTRRMPLAVG